jgi:hypothetical protein
LGLRHNRSQQLNFLGQKRVARVGYVRNAHRTTHDDQDVSTFKGRRHRRSQIEPHDMDLKIALLAEARDASRPFAIEVLKNNGPSHGILSDVIR